MYLTGHVRRRVDDDTWMITHGKFCTWSAKNGSLHAWVTDNSHVTWRVKARSSRKMIDGRLTLMNDHVLTWMKNDMQMYQYMPSYGGDQIWHCQFLGGLFADLYKYFTTLEDKISWISWQTAKSCLLWLFNLKNTEINKKWHHKRWLMHVLCVNMILIHKS